jgi:hypothetical protein
MDMVLAMIRTAYYTAEEVMRFARQGMIDDLVAKGWDRAGILITEDDPMQNGVNGYNCEQGTVRAMLVTGQADEADH